MSVAVSHVCVCVPGERQPVEEEFWRMSQCASELSVWPCIVRNVGLGVRVCVCVYVLSSLNAHDVEWPILKLHENTVQQKSVFHLEDHRCLCFMKYFGFSLRSTKI